MSKYIPASFDLTRDDVDEQIKNFYGLKGGIRNGNERDTTKEKI